APELRRLSSGPLLEADVPARDQRPRHPGQGAVQVGVQYEPPQTRDDTALGAALRRGPALVRQRLSGPQPGPGSELAPGTETANGNRRGKSAPAALASPVERRLRAQRPTAGPRAPPGRLD